MSNCLSQCAQLLKGKAAIVTGASLRNGIGRAVARRLASSGAELLLVAEGPIEGLREAQEECLKVAPNSRVEIGVYDLSEGLNAERMVENAGKLFGRIDILINNAALRISRNFGDYSRSDFQQVIGVNLAAPFFACQAVLPWMRQQGGGRIVNVASQLARAALPQRALYGLTKAGLVHLTKSIALELGKEGIIANCVSPGPINTQRAIERMKDDPSLQRELEAQVPLGRSGEPDEIAQVIFFLATSSPAFLQGEDICVDGGYTIH